ncbi:MAG: hypothetical protein WBM11_01935 [Terriglobales bacterium]
MAVFPSRSRLYRRAGWFVIPATLALMMALATAAQDSRSTQASKEPRALGLIEMTNGKARLVPIVILIDGEYYDASAYKASPVPMALWGETVYEGVKTGVSQGLFTVRDALENPETHDWVGEGTWLPASAIHAKPRHKESSPIPRGMDDDEGPPVLRHTGGKKPKAPEAAPAASPQPSNPAPAVASPAPHGPSANETKPAAQAPPPPPDQNIPVLKRGKPAPKPPEPPEPMISTHSSGVKHGTAAKSAAAAPTQMFPAISAENGPEPHSYSYPMKPDEEQQFRKQMLAMAADEVRARSRLLAGETIQPAKPAKNVHARKSAAAKLPQPTFEDVKLHVFDLNSSNEPVSVLSATARLPQSSKGGDGSGGPQYLVTLVARQDVNLDFHKVFSNVTDTSHLDIIPQMEFIDAVDVDGDGRGELLFRETSDSGTAFVVYRVIGNELYPLFQGTPGE